MGDSLNVRKIVPFLRMIVLWFSTLPLQVHPNKICSRMGLCTFDGTHGVRSGTGLLCFVDFVVNSGTLLYLLSCTISLKTLPVFISMLIESVVGENERMSSGGIADATCSACEMAVVWAENQLRQNQTQDWILNYINKVI